MPVQISINVTGLSETVRTLNDYSTQLTDRVITLALRTGAKRLKTLIQSAAPTNRNPTRFFPSGRLKKSIFFKVSKIHKRNIDGIISIYVRPKQKGGQRYGQQKNAYYANFVENGYKSRAGRQISGQKFIQRTERQHRNEIQRIIIRTTEIGASQLSRRLGL